MDHFPSLECYSEIFISPERQVCLPSSISIVSFPESFVLFLMQKKQQQQQLRISTQFASLQIWEC